MRSLLVLWLSWLAAATGGSAPVEVDVMTSQNQFLPDESLVVGVRIANLSGQTLHFGKDDDWVSFFIEARDRSVSVRELGKVPAKGEFEVESSTRATRRFDLAPYFSITQPGRYRITATVRIQEWSEERTSPPVEVDITSGTTLWEQEIGVHRTPGAQAGPPEVRKYTLQQARLIDELRLYLRVTDAREARVYRVVPIDRLVSFSKPEVQIDRHSSLHVLHQTGRRVFNYSVFDTDGMLLKRQQHEYDELTASLPRLRADADGNIKVSGGLRKLTPADVPPPTATLPPPPPPPGAFPKPHAEPQKK